MWIFSMRSMDPVSMLNALTIAVAALLLPAPVRAQAATPELDRGLNETVLMVTKKGALFSVELETTLYKPEGDGPFPVALVNHGKAPGDPRFQARYRPANAARYFLQRGYAVVVPMRQGFSRSGGAYVGGGCNVESNGRVQAEDVRAVLDWVQAQSWADKDRIVVLGQSHGGWTTLAFGAEGYPGVRGLVNFAGGLRQDQCPQWKPQLATAAAAYARTTRVPSLWFYGDNDSFFDADTYQPMLQQYASAGGNPRMVAFGRFGRDAHGMFGARAGTAIWQPEVTRFLGAIGMPYEVQPTLARYGVSSALPVPPRSGFAELEDEARLPFVRDTGREGYRKFLGRSMPRAFAVAATGAWGWAEGGDDPLQRALDNCNRNGKGACKLYAVDDYVVWKDETP